MLNNLTDAERAANFVHDPETDRVVFPIRPGMRLCEPSAPMASANTALRGWGRLPDDLDPEPNRWITTHADPRQSTPSRPSVGRRRP